MTELSNPRIKVKAINVIWETHREAVETELKKLLEVEELDPHEPQCFQQRNTAAKQVLDNMSLQEKAKIEEMVESRRSEGNPEHIRRM